MLQVEQIVQSAVRALPAFLGGRSPQSLRVEEVLPPQADDGPWRVTLSYLEPGVEEPEHPSLRGLGAMLRKPPPPERVLRVIEVDENGSALAMRLRPTG